MKIKLFYLCSIVHFLFRYIKRLCYVLRIARKVIKEHQNVSKFLTI